MSVLAAPSVPIETARVSSDAYAPVCARPGAILSVGYCKARLGNELSPRDSRHVRDESDSRKHASHRLCGAPSYLWSNDLH